jgi:hypothetical protein
MSEKTEKDLAGKTAPPTKLYGPVSDADFKALTNKSEDDSNSYSKINKAIISKLKTAGKTLGSAAGENIKKLKGE